MNYINAIHEQPNINHPVGLDQRCDPGWIVSPNSEHSLIFSPVSGVALATKVQPCNGLSAIEIVQRQFR